eukprot:Rmarinus@m.29263
MVSVNRGDHIRILRGAGIQYYHHGIYVGENAVIHYSGPAMPWNTEGPKLKFAQIMKTNFEAFLGRSSMLDVEVVEHINPFPVEKVIQLAEKFVGRKEYNLFWNNCEHFATFCKIGKGHSTQIESVANVLCGLKLSVSDTLHSVPTKHSQSPHNHRPSELNTDLKCFRRSTCPLPLPAPYHLDTVKTPKKAVPRVSHPGLPRHTTSHAPHSNRKSEHPQAVSSRCDVTSSRPLPLCASEFDPHPASPGFVRMRRLRSEGDLRDDSVVCIGKEDEMHPASPVHAGSRRLRPGEGLVGGEEKIAPPHEAMPSSQITFQCDSNSITDGPAYSNYGATSLSVWKAPASENASHVADTSLQVTCNEFSAAAHNNAPSVLGDVSLPEAVVSSSTGLASKPKTFLSSHQSVLDPVRLQHSSATPSSHQSSAPDHALYLATSHHDFTSHHSISTVSSTSTSEPDDVRKPVMDVSCVASHPQPYLTPVPLPPYNSNSAPPLSAAVAPSAAYLARGVNTMIRATVDTAIGVIVKAPLNVISNVASTAVQSVSVAATDAIETQRVKCGDVYTQVASTPSHASLRGAHV